MFLTIVKAKKYRYLCVSKSVRVAGKNRRVSIENLGTIESIMKIHGFATEEEAIEWAERYVDTLNEKIKTENEEVAVKLFPNRTRSLGDKSKVRKLGYIFLQKMYYQLGLNLICDNIQKRHKVAYDLNNIMESLLYARMISPESKLQTSDDVANYYYWNKLDIRNVYQSLSVFAQEIDYIQSQLLSNSQKLIKRDTSVLYNYNFFFETEENHNPGVRLVMCMDKNGYPLSFCVNAGNKTMVPLENNTIIIYTDAAEEKHFVTSRPVKNLNKVYRDWALDPNGWRIFTHLSEDDKLSEIAKKKIYNISEINEDAHENTIFFKKTSFDSEKKDEVLYVTYSVKYKRFIEMKRQEHIGKTACDEYVIERYDGFYGISSDSETGVGTVVNFLKNKREIEDSLYIMKTDFSHIDRIKVHFLTCYLTLFLYRFLEKHYMKEKYTSNQIIRTIREMDGSIVEGTIDNDGVDPLFEYNECCQALCSQTGVMLDKAYLLDKYLAKTIKSAKATPDKVKRLFEKQ